MKCILQRSAGLQPAFHRRRTEVGCELNAVLMNPGRLRQPRQGRNTYWNPFKQKTSSVRAILNSCRSYGAYLVFEKRFYKYSAPNGAKRYDDADAMPNLAPIEFNIQKIS